MAKKVCHISTVHQAKDIRIFLKEACFLAEEKYKVYYINTVGEEGIRGKVELISACKRSRGRLGRMTRDVWSAYICALGLKADLYHIHDPELLTAGYLLRLRGKKVIYDIHEDLPRQIFGKPYLRPYLRASISFFIERLENFFASRMSALVCATPSIESRFKAINKKTICVQNFPILGELDRKIDWSKKRKEVCYVGGITEIRGIKEVIQAFTLLTNKIRLKLIGNFDSMDLKARCKSMKAWKFVDEMGFLNRQEVAKVFETTCAGLVTFKALPNHINAQPNKMFEYMSAGLPVIASNFPAWKSIVEGHSCGICVNPDDPEAISKAVEYIVYHPKEAEEMGRRGQYAVQNYYNWQSEFQKLKALYKKLL